jgi:hypothetical protein
MLADAASEYTTSSDREQFLALVKVTEKALQVLGHEMFEKTELLTLKVALNGATSESRGSPAATDLFVQYAAGFPSDGHGGIRNAGDRCPNGHVFSSTAAINRR